MAKSKKTFVCENCGHHEPKWVGKCQSCGEWNTYVEESIIQTANKTLQSIVSTDDAAVTKLSDIVLSENMRIATGFYEFDRVLGGGFVQDEVLLISGEPGIGKSTILLQSARNLAKNNRILYVSGEESAGQIGLRASRLFGKADDTNNFLFLGSGSLIKVEESIRTEQPQFVIIDSIQTLFDESITGLPGGLSQVRAVSSKLIYLAKSLHFILVIVGHINKEGKIAGPKVLEHLVDCVLHFEGQRDGEFRVLRSIKNRFGTTGEVGIFVMNEKGLQDLNKDNSLFSTSQETHEVGIAKTLVIEGSRPIVLDIQSLASQTIFPYPKRIAEGISISKVQLLSAIADQLKQVKLLDKDLYLKTSGGYSVKNYSFADLGILAAIISSALKKPLNQHFIYVGEVALNGRVHIPKKFEAYLKEVARLFPESTLVGPQYEHKRFYPINNLHELYSLITKSA